MSSLPISSLIVSLEGAQLGQKFIAIGRNSFLVTDPVLVRELLTDRRLRSARTPKKFTISPSKKRSEEFYAYWPIFLDGAEHDLSRKLAKHSIKNSQALLSHEWLSGVIARSMRPGGTAHDWISCESSEIVHAVFARAVCTSSEQVNLLAAFSKAVLDDLAVGGKNRKHRLAVIDLSNQVWESLKQSPPNDGLLGPYISAMRLNAYSREIIIGSLTQVITGMRDPLLGGLGAVPLVLASSENPNLIKPNEILAWASPFRFTSRIVNSPLSIENMRLDEGTRVVLHLAAASQSLIRDEISTRLHFGWGEHYCIGAQLALRILESVTDIVSNYKFSVSSCVIEDALFLRFNEIRVEYS